MVLAGPTDFPSFFQALLWLELHLLAFDASILSALAQRLRDPSYLCPIDQESGWSISSRNMLNNIENDHCSWWVLKRTSFASPIDHFRLDVSHWKEDEICTLL